MSALKPAPLRPGYDYESSTRPESVFEFKLRLINTLRAIPGTEVPPGYTTHFIRLIEEFK